MRARRLAVLGLAAAVALVTACGAKVAVDGSSAPPATSSGGAGGATACEDVPALCEAYCQGFAAAGCAGKAPSCADDCLGALVLGSPAACRSAVLAAIACTVAEGPDDCLQNFSTACAAEQAALSACWDLSGPCNGYACGECGCSNEGCETSFVTQCHGVEDGVECDCIRDGELLGSCVEGGSCPSQLPGCCAAAFFPPCGP